MNAFVFSDNGGWVDVLPDPEECHDGNLEKFKVKVYTGVKMWNSQLCQNMYHSYSQMDSENNFTYFQC